MTFGVRLRLARERAGLSREELGRRLGYADAAEHVAQWERGVTHPTSTRLVDLADALDTTVGWFVRPDVLTELTVAARDDLRVRDALERWWLTLQLSAADRVGAIDDLVDLINAETRRRAKRLVGEDRVSMGRSLELMTPAFGDDKELE